MIGMDKGRMQRFDSRSAAEDAMPVADAVVPRWEVRYSSFEDCWLVAALSAQGYMLGYLLKR
jgi:hypothetical protein